jgi:uncharacterized protein (DUF1330 family)
MSDDANGYWIVTAAITDAGAFRRYTAVAGPVMARAGARVLASPAVFEVVEGTLNGVPFLVEFPSYQAARECYRSPEYQAAVALRDGAAQFDVVIVEGV